MKSPIKDDVFHTHLLLAKLDGSLDRRDNGRFLIHNGQLHVLEDNYGLIGKTIPEGAVDDYTVQKINNPGPHLSVASHHDIEAGHRLDFIPEHPLKDPYQPKDVKLPEVPAKVQPPGVFHYQRVGHDRPHVLESKAGQYLLDGNPLKDEEVATILDNIRGGVARIRYPKAGMQDTISKMEINMRSLRKAVSDLDPNDPEGALAHLDRLGITDPTTRQALATLRSHVFEDPMVHGIGNKFSYTQFRNRNPAGTWASIDINDLKHLNDTQGHDAGDALIRAFGASARAGANPDQVKLFRPGGDEFVLHAPDPETAYSTMRVVRNHLDQVPPIGGSHKPSFSVGFGNDFATADKALYQAKAQKFHIDPTGAKVRAFEPGQVPHLAHSLVPGHEGPVPLHDERLHPPKLPSPPVSAGVSAPSSEISRQVKVA